MKKKILIWIIATLGISCYSNVSTGFGSFNKQEIVLGLGVASYKGDIGSKITITDLGGQNRTRELTVIGIMDQMFFFTGIIVKKEVATNEYGGVESMFVAKLNSGEDAEDVAKEFERTYLELGLQTFDMKGIINTILSLSNNIMYLMEGFLGIGLLVGIAGIGIISYRNVIERRQQIGMLRAIGFKKSMVTKSFSSRPCFLQ